MTVLAPLVALVSMQAAPTAVDYPGSVAYPGFGSSVAVEGDSLIVGSVEIRPCCNQRGEAHLFTRNGPGAAWSHVSTFRSAFGRNLGTTVALSGDVAVAAERPDDTAQVVVAERFPGGWMWSDIFTYPGSSALDVRYGESLAVVDGRVLVSASGGRDGGGSATGVVYVYERVAGSWTQTQRLLPPPDMGGQIPQRTRFGRRIATDGDLLAISAPDANVGAVSEAGRVHVFRWDTAATPAPGYQFVESIDAPLLMDQRGFGGTGLDVSVGRIAVASADVSVQGIAAAGCVHLYECASTGCVEVARLHDPKPSAGARFGESLSLCGERLAVGRNAGARRLFADLPLTVEVFESSGGTWSLASTLPDPIEAGDTGFGNALSLDGATLAAGFAGAVVGVEDRGACYVGDVALGWAPVASVVCGGGHCACPGRSFEGCGNSALEYATLSAFGSSSITRDDLLLSLADAVPGATARLLLGRGIAPPRVFGDGVLCVASPLSLLPVTTDGVGIAIFPTGLVSRASQQLGAAGSILAGETWVLQAMYADHATLFGCTTHDQYQVAGIENGRPYLVSRGFNLSNAIEITFAP